MKIDTSACAICRAKPEPGGAGLHVCEWPPVGAPTCGRALCSRHVKFYGPIRIAACPEHAAGMQAAIEKTPGKDPR